MTDDVRYIKRLPTVAEFQALRKDAGWRIPPEAVLRASLPRSVFGVCVDADGTTIGMGRIVGDGGIQIFVADVIVRKEWQRKGIGSQIMKMLMKYVDEEVDPAAFVGLFSAFGREEFYRKFGFIMRPNETLGAGMIYFPKG